jgi:hypothetical protein
MLRVACLAASYNLPFCVVAGGVFAVEAFLGEDISPYAPNTVLGPVELGTPSVFVE